MVRWQGRLGAAALVLVVLAVGARGQSPHVKVHKDRVTVSPPDGRGMVAVRGAAGAVISSSEVTLTVANQTTEAQGSASLGPDGSFVGEVSAAVGEKVRILAKNAQGKRSYGTFTVPAQAVSAAGAVGIAVEASEQAGPVQAAQVTAEPERWPVRQGGRRQLAVLVMVVDLGTGELIAAERVVGALQDALAGRPAFPARGEPGLPVEETLALVQEALEEGSALEMTYYTAGRDELTHRVVEPLRLETRGGVAYLVGFCHRAQAERVFRVDRIRSLARVRE